MKKKTVEEPKEHIVLGTCKNCIYGVLKKHNKVKCDKLKGYHDPDWFCGFIKTIRG